MTQKQWHKQYYQKHRSEFLEKARLKCQAMKKELIDAYGGRCVCCGETRTVFLTIEHVRRDGRQHRKTVGRGMQTYRHIKKLGYPKDLYTILCFNCNWASYWGMCPHKEMIAV